MIAYSKQCSGSALGSTTTSTCTVNRRSSLELAFAFSPPSFRSSIPGLVLILVFCSPPALGRRLFVNLSRIETCSLSLDSQITVGQELYDRLFKSLTCLILLHFQMVKRSRSGQTSRPKSLRVSRYVVPFCL